MRFFIASAAGLFLGAFTLGAEVTDRPLPVDCLCGHLQKEQELPAKRGGEGIRVREVSVGKTSVRLYSRTENQPCCMTAVAEVLTHRDGKFEFKRIAAGNYWLVAIIEGHQYSVALEYKPRGNQQSDCEEFFYTATKAGRFDVKAMITVT